MAATISPGTDFDHDAWTRPEDEVRPSADLADPYGEGFGHYLARVDSARGLWEISWLASQSVGISAGTSPAESFGLCATALWARLLRLGSSAKDTKLTS